MRVQWRRISIIAAICIIILGFVLWHFRSNESKPIVLGAIVPMTGAVATFGKWAEAGLTMAIEDINRSGGVERRKLELVVEDSAADPSKAVSGLRKLVDIDHAEAIFSIVSAVDLALIPIIEREPVVLISHATHPAITKDRKHVLRHSPTVQEETEVITNSLTTEDVSEGVAILYLNDDYGAAVVNEIKLKILQKFPGTRINVVSYERDESLFTAQVSRAIADKPRLVIVAGLGKSSGLPIRRLREVAFRGKIIATLGFIVTDGPVAAGAAAEGVWAVDLQPPTEVGTSSLQQRYKDRTGESKLPMTVVFFYNSVQLWASARSAVGANDPDKIVSYVKGIGSFSGTGEVIKIDPNGDMLPPVRLIQYRRSGQ